MEHRQSSQPATPAAVRRALQQTGHRPRRSLGQNFLVHPPTVDRIIAAAELTAADLALEIGPGLGVLTERLLNKAGRVVAVELDRDLAGRLAHEFGRRDNFTLVVGDATKVELAAHWVSWDGPVKVVANLPYQVTTPVLQRLLLEPVPFERAVLMVQREVAERMMASPGGRVYGSLSVLVQYWCEPRLVTVVPPTAFRPVPKVESAVICLHRRAEPAVAVPAPVLFPVVRAGFGQRRKTLRNALSAGLQLEPAAVERALTAVGVDPVRRAETLSLAEFAAIATQLAGAVPGGHNDGQ